MDLFFFPLIVGEPSTGLNLNHRLFRIWQYVHFSFYSITKFSVLPPLNVINRFQIEQCWNLLRQRETARWCKKKISSPRMKLIFTLVAMLISKFVIFGAQKGHTWSYRSKQYDFYRICNTWKPRNSGEMGCEVAIV